MRLSLIHIFRFQRAVLRAQIMKLHLFRLPQPLSVGKEAPPAFRADQRAAQKRSARAHKVVRPRWHAQHEGMGRHVAGDHLSLIHI